MNNRPLVSIVVLTYNSSEYVLETLNSAYIQTYSGDLELIITDDCSMDNTVEICSQWLLIHSNRFVKTKLITIEENTGVSKNINRGCRAARGEWIKPIAGDDILMNHCIDTLINFAIEKGKECRVISSLIKTFNTSSTLMQYNNMQSCCPIITNERITLDDIIDTTPSPLAPGMIYEANLMKSVNYFEETFRNIEDMPTYYKILSEGHCIFVLKIVTVYYRVHSNSISTLPIYKINDITSDYRRIIFCYMTYVFRRLKFKKKVVLYLRLLPMKLYLRTGGRCKFLTSFCYIVTKSIRAKLGSNNK